MLSLQAVCVFGVIIQVVAVYGSLEDLLSVASSKLGIRASSVYNGNGGLIDDISLIRWDSSSTTVSYRAPGYSCVNLATFRIEKLGKSKCD